MEVSVCKGLAEKGIYFESGGIIEVFRKNKEGLYVSSRDQSKRANIDEFKDINAEVLENLEKVETLVTFLSEQLDYNLEFRQLTMFGENMNDDQRNGYISSLISVLVMLFQEVVNQFMK